MKITKTEIKKILNRAIEKNKGIVLIYMNGAKEFYSYSSDGEEHEKTMNEFINYIYTRATEKNNSIFYNSLIAIEYGDD